MNIRKVSIKDAESILKIYEYYILNTAVTFEYDVPPLKDFQERIKKIASFYPYLVYEDNGQILGYAYASRFRERKAYDWDAELSVYVDKNCTHNGIGQILYNNLLNILKEMNILNVYAAISYPNDRSENFHNKCGFKKIALFENVGFKFGKWHNLIYMHKNINEFQTPPNKVKNVKEIEIF